MQVLRTFAGIARALKGNFDPYVMKKNEVLVEKNISTRINLNTHYSGIAI